MSNEARFQSLFAAMTEAVALHRVEYDSAGQPRDYVILDVNPAFSTHTGLPREAVVGKRASEIAGAASAPLLEIYARVQAGNAPASFEHFSATTQRHFRIKLLAVAAGEFATVFEDITARRQTEDALAQSEARFRAIVEASPVPLRLSDATQRITFVNSAFVNTFGYTVDEIPTLSDWWDRAYPDPAYRTYAIEAWRLKFSEAQRIHRAPEPIELLIRCKNGDERTVLASAAPPGDMPDGVQIASFVDVTERQRSVAELTASKRLLENIIEAAPVRVFWKDNDLRYLGCNTAFARDAGKTRPGEVIGHNDYEMNWAASADLYRADDRQVIASGTARLSYEEPQQTADGHTLWLSTSKVPLRDQRDEIVGVLGIYEDITERKQLADALREREQYQRALLDNFPFLVWLKDSEGRLLAANKPYADGCGKRSPAELVGLTDFDVWPADLAAAYRRDDREVLESGIARNVEEQIEVSGERVWFETYKSPVSIDGQVIGTVGFARDITARKNNETELAQHRHNLEQLVEQRTADLIATESRASLLLESSADGLYGLDGKGNITFINPAACAMLGLDSNAVIGCNAHDLFHHTRPDGTPYPMAECPTHQALEHGRTVRVDNEVYWRPDGTAIPVMYAVHPVARAGSNAGAVISVVDMSAQRATEHAREQALIAAENLARVRREFLANMSHEIRTPLNGVLGFARIGQRHCYDADKVRTAFERILSSGSLLLGIIDDILDFSKIEAGKIHIELTEVNLVEVIEHAVSLIEERARAKGLAIQIALAPDLPRQCVTDGLRLNQVLLNLLSNAVKFTARGSIGVTVTRKQDRLVFSVSDTGIGMHDEQLHRLFQPFEQADGSTTRKFGGTGLGLAISKHLLELMGGSIRVESWYGKGSTVEFDLPCIEPAAGGAPRAAAPQPAAPAPTAPSDGTPLDGLNILVAEDDEVNRIILEEFLADTGARLTFATNGLEAVQRVMHDGADAYDLVLMDVQMPKMDGYEATRRILAMAPALPIIGQTAHAFGEEKEKCFQAGMLAHIAKPIEPTELVNLIRQYAVRGARTKTS